MRLYSLDGATVVATEHGEFTADDDGGFLFPDDVSDHLGRTPGWENDVQRAGRLATEDDTRRKDPATLLAAVEQLVAAQTEPEPVKPHKPRAPRKPSS